MGKLWGYFGLSYASWITMPRVLLHAMPDEWQDKMADLMREYEDAFPGVPSFGTVVRTTDSNGKLVKAPEWLNNYRHPDMDLIESFKKTTQRN